MKKILIICLLSIAGYSAFAQQKPRVKHMTITIIDDHAGIIIGKKPNNLFITRDDTAQVQKRIDMNTHAKAKDAPAAYEQLLMQMLKPYYADNWKLVSTSAEFNQNTNEDTFRYYFIK